MTAKQIQDLMKNVAVGSLATCFAACVTLLVIYAYSKATAK